MWYLIIIGVVTIFCLLSVWKKIRKKQARELEMRQNAQDKLREKELDERILNKKGIKSEISETALPIQVNYSADQIEKIDKKSGKKENELMVQIVENTKLSSKKYVLNPEKPITIGNVQGKNSIVVDYNSGTDEQCEIILNNGTFYVKSTVGSNNICLMRGKKTVQISKNYLEMKSGDGILFGETLFRVEFIRLKSN